MKASATLYWVYCIVNMMFGSSVEIQRDRLRRIYVVNRHSIYLHPRDQTPVERIQKNLAEGLLNCGWTFNGSYYRKKYDNSEIVINISIQDNSVSVCIFSYKI